jgi:hypothetical protein
MNKYTVQWDYSSGLGGPWAAGETVELDETRAADINRDSPGVLVEVGPVDEAPIPAARDRMVKRAKHRGVGGPQEPIDKTTFKAVKDE